MAFPYGLPEEWDQTDEGDVAIYVTDPLEIPMTHLPRVVYELRQDIAQLGAEVMNRRKGTGAIIIVGNPVDGFRFIGPFVDGDDAVRSATTHLEPEWCVARLDTMAEYVNGVD